jgi:hypothetical protein
VKILVFTEGTIIMHSGGEKHTSEEISQQVQKKEKTLFDWGSYIPIGQAVEKLRKWSSQGAEIFYLTSRTKPTEIKSIQQVLKKHSFPAGDLLFRKNNQQYKDIAEEVAPDILVEDDCESIGGADEMTITHVRPELRAKIRSVPVKEFGGIDHLSDNITKLLSGNPLE